MPAHDVITEALLEMHFHSALVRLFEEHFGRKFLRLLKPSQNREAFLGFDQGWIRTSVPLTTFRHQLEQAIKQGASALETLYVGYFLQFKRVQKASRRNRDLPSDFPVPYYRAELDLQPNRTTRRSQHETLLRLEAMDGCDVHYACPMIFDEDKLYDPPDVSDLRIVPLSEAPTGYASNESHHICFRAADDASPYRNLSTTLRQRDSGFTDSGSRTWAC